MVESLFWNPAFDVAPAARWWAMSKDWWRLRPGAFLAPASSFFVVKPKILGDPWTIGGAKHHSCFLSDIVSVEGGHQKPFVRTPLVLQTINQLIKIFTQYDTRTCLVSISPKLSMFHLCSLLFNKINQELPVNCQKRQSRNRWLHMKKKQMTNYYRNNGALTSSNTMTTGAPSVLERRSWLLVDGLKILIVDGWSRQEVQRPQSGLFVAQKCGLPLRKSWFSSQKVKFSWPLGQISFRTLVREQKKPKIGPNRCARCTLLTCLCLCLPTIVTIHQCIFAPKL